MAFYQATYARRGMVELCNNRLERWRALAMRFEKRIANDRALVVSASMAIRLSS